MEEAKPKVDLKVKFASLKDNLTEYASIYKDLAKAKAVKGVSNVTAAIVIGVTASILAFLFLILAGFGLAWWLGNVLNNRAAGFFAAAGVFLLLCLLLFVTRRKLIVPLIRNMIISKFYE